MEDRVSSFSADGMTLDDLKNLHTLFESFDEDGDEDGEGGGGLSERDFVKAFEKILGDNLTEQQLTQLFMKIDANSDGSVDWDEFTNFMFLNNQDKNKSVGTDDDVVNLFLPQIEDKSDLSSSKHFHKESIHGIKFLDKLNLVMSFSKDGCIRTWTPLNLTLVTTILNGNRNKDWITDVIHMHFCNKLAVASMDNCLTFYDLQTDSRKIVGRIPPSTFKQASPLCFDYFYDSVQNKELLIVGDDVGIITFFIFSDRNWHACDGTLECHDKATLENVSKFCIKKHSDHITKVQYIPDLSCVISSSLDSTLLVIDLERRRVKRSFQQHKKAVYSFAWCSNSKVIASCGLERDIILWSTYSKKSMATLHGHNASVCSVVANDITNQLISLSVDHTIRVWDIRNQKCVQIIQDNNALSTFHLYNNITSILYNPKNKALYTGSNNLKLWRQSESVVKTKTSHSAAVSGALYNRSFHQVISADIENPSVIVWNVETGQITSQFDVSEDVSSFNNGSFITTMCFDDGGRRLITGGNDGNEIRMWNFSNGSLLTKFVKDEISDENLETAKDEDSLLSLAELKESRRLATIKKKDEENNESIEIFTDSPTGYNISTDAIKKVEVSKKDYIKNIKKEEDNKKSNKKNGGNETTFVIYAATNATSNSSSSNEQNQYIVSAGWDRQLYVWRDGDAGSSKDVGYLMIMPEKGIHGHSDDITSLIFVPPHWVVTGGIDKKVVLWNVNSGSIGRVFNLNSPIEKMLHLERFDLLVVSCNGVLNFLDIHTFSMTSFKIPNLDLKDSVTHIHADSTNDYMFTGDSTGHVTVWQLTNPRFTKAFIKNISFWQAHKAAITALDYVENSRIMETFLLTAGENGDISLWTLTGAHVGVFGQEHKWNLDDASTYRSLFECSVPEDINLRITMDESKNTHKKYSVSINPHRKSQLRRPSLTTISTKKSNNTTIKPTSGIIEMMRPQNLKSGKSVYRVASVWVRRNIMGDYIDIITITRVDEVQNLVAGYDGLTVPIDNVKPPTLNIPLQDMMKVKDKLPWEEIDELGLRIGRIFKDNSKICAKPKSPSDLYPALYKTLFLRYRDNRWLVVDTNLQEHSIAPLGESLPSRSLSIFKREILIDFETKLSISEIKLMSEEDARSRQASHGREKKDKVLDKINSTITRKRSVSITNNNNKEEAVRKGEKVGLLSESDTISTTGGVASSSTTTTTAESSADVKIITSSLPIIINNNSNNNVDVRKFEALKMSEVGKTLTAVSSLSSSTNTSGQLQQEYQLLKKNKRPYTTDKRKVQAIVDVPGLYARLNKKREEERTPKVHIYPPINIDHVEVPNSANK